MISIETTVAELGLIVRLNIQSAVIFYEEHFMMNSHTSDLDLREAEQVQRLLTNLMQQEHKETKSMASLVHEFRAGLAKVSSMKAFHEYVKEIIEQGKRLAEIYLPNSELPNQKVVDSVKSQLKGDKDKCAIVDLMYYSSTFKQEIVSNKERLMLVDMKKKLSPDEFTQLEKSIQKVKSLEPKAQRMRKMLEDYKQQLATVDSLKDFYRIEASTNELHAKAEKAYHELEIFPENDDKATTLLQFLNDNPHLKGILEAFNVKDQLSGVMLQTEGRLRDMSMSQNAMGGH